ncbi:MAG TPA: gluconate 2-dehydrogenase subunit 3 family protein [Woeseiaceae bacterium]|nr:gluconate 2-dehydrogenase subunit 3 family protein [Woeseiaceae bacterium]
MSKKTLLSVSITRREAIFRVSAIFGGAALVGQAAMLAGCAEEAAPVAPADDAGAKDAGDGLFSAADIARLDEIAETILPETGTPGAKAAGVGPFMALMVRDCYYPEDQAIFRTGLETLNDESVAENGKDFMDASPAERLALLQRLDREQQEYSSNQAEDAPAHYFRMLKELALLGYFTSEIGYTQAMRYAETPGRYDPCAPLEPGGRIWADHA